MKIKVATVVNQLVDTLLTRGTADKLLHIRVHVHYLYFPHAYPNGSDCSDEIEKTFFIHFIFYRPSSYTKVLVLKSNKPMIEESDVFKMVSDHDSCWRSDGTEHSLFKIHQEIITMIENRCQELGVEPSPYLRLDQPNFSDIDVIELIDGKTQGVDYDNRECRMTKSGNLVIFKA